VPGLRAVRAGTCVCDASRSCACAYRTLALALRRVTWDVVIALIVVGDIRAPSSALSARPLRASTVGMEKHVTLAADCPAPRGSFSAIAASVVISAALETARRALRAGATSAAHSKRHSERVELAAGRRLSCGASRCRSTRCRPRRDRTSPPTYSKAPPGRCAFVTTDRHRPSNREHKPSEGKKRSNCRAWLRGIAARPILAAVSGENRAARVTAQARNLRGAAAQSPRCAMEACAPDHRSAAVCT
jgi:hypothetical protein